MNQDAAYWEKLLEEEGLSSHVPSQWTMSLKEEITHEDHSLGLHVVHEKDEDHPDRVSALSEVASLAQRLPSKWKVMLILRARGASQYVIAARMGTYQPVVCKQLRRLYRVLPVLHAAGTPTEEDVEDWVTKSIKLMNIDHVHGPRRPLTHEACACLVKTFLRVWSLEHARALCREQGHLMNMTQTQTLLNRGCAKFPEHVVSKTLVVMRKPGHRVDSRADGFDHILAGGEIG